jgi:lipopolysaccharide export LptBFGC system permease protein LptF
MKPLARKFLAFKREPAVSGLPDRVPVGGEILPINSLQLLLANLWWIFLLAIPLVIYLLAARYGVRIPRHFRQALRLVPIVVLTLG